jgi:hypothetical protein
VYPLTPALAARAVAFLGRGDPGQAETHVEAATSFVKAYTRGIGFMFEEPNDELQAVIVTTAARTLSNPGSKQSETAGPYTTSLFKVDTNFTLTERAVLDRYRVRAR